VAVASAVPYAKHLHLALDHVAVYYCGMLRNVAGQQNLTFFTFQIFRGG